MLASEIQSEIKWIVCSRSRSMRTEHRCIGKNRRPESAAKSDCPVTDRPDDDAAAEKYRKSIESPAKSDGREKKVEATQERKISGRNTTKNETVRAADNFFAFDEGQLVKGGGPIFHSAVGPFHSFVRFFLLFVWAFFHLIIVSAFLCVPLRARRSISFRRDFSFSRCACCAPLESEVIRSNHRHFLL
jgi:hypothetical protein